MVKLIKENDPMVQKPLSVQDKKFKEAVRFCDGTVEDLAFELWKRYVDLEDAVNLIKTFYEGSIGRRSLMSDINSHLNMGDLEDVIEEVYFENDHWMETASKHFGRV